MAVSTGPRPTSFYGHAVYDLFQDPIYPTFNWRRSYQIYRHISTIYAFQENRHAIHPDLFRWNGTALWGIFLFPSKKHNNREG